MSSPANIPILPYSRIVGQTQIKLALEIAYVAPPRLGGVLISGQRGTGKSTAVRAFAKMVYDQLPVTLPINATEDRVIGGWKIDALMRSESTWQRGLLEDASEKGLLYVDEVNLLDDHIVNIILDVTSTGVLVVQRDGQNQQSEKVTFTMVGTMNPEEGGLRPQLLDRFGLMVSVAAETDAEKRLAILQNVLEFDQAVFLEQTGTSDWLDQARRQDQEKFEKLKQAKENFNSVKVSSKILELCIKLSGEFQAEGNRGDYVLAMAARACAALEGASQVTRSHLKVVAPLALQHRRPQMAQSSQEIWNDQDRDTLDQLLGSE